MLLLHLSCRISSVARNCSSGKSFTFYVPHLLGNCWHLCLNLISTFYQLSPSSLQLAEREKSIYLCLLQGLNKVIGVADNTGCITGIFRPIIACTMPCSTGFEFLVLSSLRGLLQQIARRTVNRDVYLKQCESPL